MLEKILCTSVCLSFEAKKLIITDTRTTFLIHIAVLLKDNHFCTVSSISDLEAVMLSDYTDLQTDRYRCS